MTKPNSITVIGRRWFQESYGNTYHSVSVTNDDTGETLYTPFEYGYGNQYEETAAQMIEDAGWLPKRDRKSGAIRIWLEEIHGVKLNTEVEDVKRKKDL